MSFRNKDNSKNTCAMVAASILTILSLVLIGLGIWQCNDKWGGEETGRWMQKYRNGVKEGAPYKERKFSNEG